MNTRYTALVILLFSAAISSAQSYCSPTFDFGCFNWRTLSITAGTLDWTPGSDACDVSDYTGTSVAVNAGDDLAMTVVNGAWCGCAVWVDLDNSSSFEDNENLYYIYVGGSPSYTYDFSIAIPSGMPTGSYRMRVISPWGSDGFLSTNTNGFGPCGSYQYGNFVDLTLDVAGSNGLADGAMPYDLTLAPNPTTGDVVVSTGGAAEQITVRDTQGRLVLQQRVQGDRMTLDTRSWDSGLYLVQVTGPAGGATQHLVVE